MPYVKDKSGLMVFRGTMSDDDWAKLMARTDRIVMSPSANYRARLLQAGRQEEEPLPLQQEEPPQNQERDVTQ